MTGADSIEQLETRLAAATGAGRVEDLIELADAVAGTDAVRAERLADEATIASRSMAGDEAVRLEALALVARSWARHVLSRLVDSHDDAERALALTKSIADPIARARALHAVGVARGARGQLASALQALEERLDVARASDPRSSLVGRILTGLTVVHSEAGRYRQGQECAIAAASLARELGLAREEAVALSNLGGILAATGDLPGALERFLAAVDLWRHLDEHGSVGRTLCNVAHLYLRAGLVDEALEAGEEALALSRGQSSGRLFEGVAETVLSGIWLERKDLTQARAFAEAAVATSRRIGSDARLADALGGLAEVERHAGARVKSLALIEEALALARGSGLRREEANALLVLGELRFEDGAEELAAESLRQAAALVHDLGEPQIEADLHELSSRIHERAGRPAEALAHSRTRERVLDELRREHAGARIARLRVAHEIESARIAAVEARRQGAATFQAIVDHTPSVAVTGYDRARRVRLWNGAAQSLYGWSAAEAIGRQAGELYLDADEAKRFEQMSEVVDAENPVLPSFEAPFRTRAGTTGIVSSTLFPIVDARGERMLVRMDVDLSERKRAELDLRRALGELEDLRARLQAENAYLRDEVQHGDQFEDTVGQSPEWRHVLRLVKQVAPTDATVLLLGETGTGKELIARAIHARSERRDRTLVKVDCAALPPTLIESELFGHEKGAFTGAHARSAGRFELADRGSIFLDEIGELPLELQGKLLRVLQDRELERVGSQRPLRIDVRVIAATNRDLAGEVEAGRFRRDLFYRLNVFPIELPPLRERRSDIPLLVEYLIEKKRRRVGRRHAMVAPEAMATLVGYHWPGNVRELENVIERAMIVSTGESLMLADRLLAAAAPTTARDETLEQAERAHIERALRASGGRIKGEHGAAERLGLNPSTLRFRMKRLGIEREP